MDVSKFQAREPGEPVGFHYRARPVARVGGRTENVTDGTAEMHADRKSHGPIVPAKRANKAGTPVAESVEERGSPEGTAAAACSHRTQRRTKRDTDAIGDGNVKMDSISTVILKGGAG